MIHLVVDHLDGLDFQNCCVWIYVIDVLELCFTKNFKKFSLKVALQKWIIDLSNIKISKNHHILNLPQ
jgi:hypothetical protein